MDNDDDVTYRENSLLGCSETRADTLSAPKPVPEPEPAAEDDAEDPITLAKRMGWMDERGNWIVGRPRPKTHGRRQPLCNGTGTTGGGTETTSPVTNLKRVTSITRAFRDAGATLAGLCRTSVTGIWASARREFKVGSIHDIQAERLREWLDREIALAREERAQEQAAAARIWAHLNALDDDESVRGGSVNRHAQDGAASNDREVSPQPDQVIEAADRGVPPTVTEPSRGEASPPKRPEPHEGEDGDLIAPRTDLGWAEEQGKPIAVRRRTVTVAPCRRGPSKRILAKQACAGSILVGATPSLSTTTPEAAAEDDIDFAQILRDL